MLSAILLFPNNDLSELDKAYNEWIWLWVIFIFGITLLPVIALTLIDDFKNRNKPKRYILKRTKNPYRRYKRVYIR